MPSIFIAGGSDWGVEQTPGALRRMRSWPARSMQGVHLVEGAGHWVQQEQPEQVIDLLLSWLG